MIQPTMLFGTVLSVISSGIYYYVGHVLGQRRATTPDARLAWSMFVVWWFALAGTTLSGAVLDVLGTLAITDLPLFVTMTLVNLLATCVALFGLVYYLLYLFTGSRRLLAPLTLFYIAYYILIVYYVEASGPTSIAVDRWGATLQYENQITGPLFFVTLFLLVFPQILGSLAYFTLFFRVHNATQKYRVTLVSWSVIIWFLSAFLANISGLSQQDWWQVASRMIGLGAAFTILLAYKPPELIKHRFGVASIVEE